MNNCLPKQNYCSTANSFLLFVVGGRDYAKILSSKILEVYTLNYGFSIFKRSSGIRIMLTLSYI